MKRKGEGCSSINLTAAPISGSMCNAIKKERQLMEKKFESVIKKTSNEEFAEVAPGLFLYGNWQYVPMSKVTLSLLQDCWLQLGNCRKGKVTLCKDEQHLSYDGYYSFSNDNTACLEYYKEIIADPDVDNNQKKVLDQYRTRLLSVIRGKDHRYTAFHTNSIPFVSSWDLDEDE